MKKVLLSVFLGLGLSTAALAAALGELEYDQTHEPATQAAGASYWVGDTPTPEPVSSELAFAVITDYGFEVDDSE